MANQWMATCPSRPAASPPRLPTDTFRSPSGSWRMGGGLMTESNIPGRQAGRQAPSRQRELTSTLSHSSSGRSTRCRQCTTAGPLGWSRRCARRKGAARAWGEGRQGLALRVMQGGRGETSQEESEGQAVYGKRQEAGALQVRCRACMHTPQGRLSVPANRPEAGSWCLMELAQGQLASNLKSSAHLLPDGVVRPGQRPHLRRHPARPQGDAAGRGLEAAQHSTQSSGRRVTQSTATCATASSQSSTAPLHTPLNKQPEGGKPASFKAAPPQQRIRVQHPNHSTHTLLPTCRRTAGSRQTSLRQSDV